MLSPHALNRALTDAGITVPGRFEEVTDSTNRVAIEMAAGGAPEWTVVATGHQTAGRGRLGRSWVSEPGGSLLFSVILRPRLDPDQVLLLSLAAGAATAEAASAASGLEVRCKWPNDLLVGDAKVGGILSEAKVAGRTVAYVVTGVGVNLAGPPEGVEGAAGLGLGSDQAGLVLSGILGRFRALASGRSDDFPGGVLAAYRPVCGTLGARVRATGLDGSAVEGLAADLDSRGNLVVETEDGRTSVGFGDLLHLRSRKV